MKVARQLIARLADLSAADKITEIVAARPRADEARHVRDFLHPPHKLVLEPAMKPIPKLVTERLDWGAIEHFCVTAVN